MQKLGADVNAIGEGKKAQLNTPNKNAKPIKTAAR